MRIMKKNVTFCLLAASLLFLGCASSQQSKSTSAEGKTEKSEAAQPVGARTAYDGETGPRLLMERYRTGEIQGLND